MNPAGAEVVAPTLKVFSHAAIAEFLSKREAYIRAVDDKNNGSKRAKIVPVSVRGSVHTPLLRTICEMDLDIDIDEITDQDLLDYFKDLLRMSTEYVGANIERLFESVSMPNREDVPSLEFRVRNLWSSWIEARNTHQVEQMFATKKGKKILRARIVEKLKPLGLKTRVQLKLEDLSPDAEDIRKNDKLFYKYLLKAARDVQQDFELNKITRTKRKYNGTPPTDLNRPNKRPHKEKRSNMKCYKCGKLGHKIRNCPEVSSSDEAKTIFQEVLRSGVSKRLRSLRKSKQSVTAILEGTMELPCLLDSGADSTCMGKKSFQKLKSGLKSQGRRLQLQGEPLSFRLAVSDAQTQAIGNVKVDVQVRTRAGVTILRRVVCYILEDETNCLILGRTELESLGVDPLTQLESLINSSSQYQVSSVEQVIDTTRGGAHLDYTNSSSDVDSHPTNQEIGSNTTTAVMSVSQAIELMIAKCRSKGASSDQCTQLFHLATEFKDIWRIKLYKDDPAKVTPLKIRLRDNAVPKRARARRYSPIQRKFLSDMTKKLVKAGYIKRNYNSRWSSPSYVVPKKTSYRMTIDLQYVNSQCEPLAGVMPILEVVLQHLNGSQLFATLDAFKGYWQFPLHEDSREILSFATHEGIFSPTRIIQGSQDAVFAFQAGMEEAMGKLLYQCVLIWVDDILVYSRNSFQEHIHNLKRVFELLQSFNIKLNPLKCTLFAKEVTWVGRVISASGVSFDKELLEGLVKLQRPRTAADLQRFLCAANWIRTSIPDYAKAVGRLQKKLLACKKAVNSQKTSRLRHKILDWTSQDEEAFLRLKLIISRSVTLNHPDEAKTMCLFSDASDLHWGLVLTQIDPKELKKSVKYQKHEPLAFLSGSFKGSELNWSIIEKEAWPIVKACIRLKHFLHSERPFHMFTDHRNLIYIFNPASRTNEVSKQVAEKLERWTLALRSYRYVIEHIPGEVNYWPDILSRWMQKSEARKIAPMQQICSVSEDEPATTTEIDSPKLLKDVRKAQNRYTFMVESVKEALYKDKHDGYIRTVNKKRIWVPARSAAGKSLVLRIMVLGHCGINGHRKLQSTFQRISQVFYWEQMKCDISEFCKKCIHCIVNGPERIPRPLGEQIHASKPNTVLHYDFCYIQESDSRMKIPYRYVLVIKDDFSGFVELIPSVDATHHVVVEALLDWFSRFGFAQMHISDRGSHFKNKVVKELNRRLGTSHHFTTQYSPWSNGTVEVVNRHLLTAFRALCSEFQLPLWQWNYLIPFVQSTLNHSPTPRLSNHCPTEVFTGLRPKSTLDCVFNSSKDEFVATNLSVNAIQEYVVEIRRGLDQLHKKIHLSKSRLRDSSRQSRDKNVRKSLPRYHIGDFVLVAVVKKRSKLSARWTGPWKVVSSISDHVFIVENLLSRKRRTVHTQRLKFYSDKNLNITTNLKESIAYNSPQDVYQIEKFIDHRIDDYGLPQLKVV